jgi:hypothetical protein
MDLKSMIDTAVPTPYGWMIMTQREFDLEAMISFQKQLISLSNAFGPSKVPASAPPVAVLSNPRA